MNDNTKLLEKFYTGFKNSDSGAMIECYHAEVEFSDPVFPCLKGKQAMAMWAMLCQRRADPADRWFNNIQAAAHEGSAHWEAKYVFPTTGRRVHNKVDARVTFKDGKIIKHVDSFSFWKWSAMALGPVGFALGWTPFLKNKIRQKLRAMLNEFIETHPEFR